MATRPKKSQSKKPPKKSIAAVQESKAAIREEPAPVLVNAVEPNERLPDPRADTAQTAVATMEKSLKAAMPVAVAVNRKLVDIAQANLNSGLELARDLVGAKTPMEMMRLHMNYWHDNAGVFQSQAQELRSLSAKLLATASEPIREQMRRM
ncbi:MAG: phasin family protein [Methyloceanibacter sp.]|uniref:phasin family protein n=1 Tax=Methyloceanibacter sp. TaxID=1965321 RepID=UPI003D6D17AE